MSKAKKPGLLVSVLSAEEAEIALKGGADLIDVKDPARGPLGMAHHETVAAVIATVGGKVPVSAALGEWGPNALTDAGWHLELPLQYVKWGLAKYPVPLGAGEELLEARRRVPVTTEVVMVAYADWDAAKSPPPAELVKLARRVRYKAFLFDTFDKKGKTLLDHLPPAELGELVQSLKRAGIAVALGGSLKVEQVKALKELEPDWLAVRGAVCAGNKRDGMLDAVRLKKWKDALKA
jgi:(5-formylfuran-3-yl)methyl phosphate synthase